MYSVSSAWPQQPCGLPHWEILGSKDVCSSPRLIAACHVLHRRLVPRHPPLRTYLLDRHPVLEFQRYSMSRVEIPCQVQPEMVGYSLHSLPVSPLKPSQLLDIGTSGRTKSARRTLPKALTLSTSVFKQLDVRRINHCRTTVCTEYRGFE